MLRGYQQFGMTLSESFLEHVADMCMITSLRNYFSAAGIGVGDCARLRKITKGQNSTGAHTIWAAIGDPDSTTTEYLGA